MTEKKQIQMQKRPGCRRGAEYVEKTVYTSEVAVLRWGELEGAAARLEWDRMPRKALFGKARGERSEDFCTAAQCESNGIFWLSKSPTGFFDSQKRPGCRRGASA